MQQASRKRLYPLRLYVVYYYILCMTPSKIGRERTVFLFHLFFCFVLFSSPLLFLSPTLSFFLILAFLISLKPFPFLFKNGQFFSLQHNSTLLFIHTLESNIYIIYNIHSHKAQIHAYHSLRKDTYISMSHSINHPTKHNTIYNSLMVHVDIQIYYLHIHTCYVLMRHPYMHVGQVKRCLGDKVTTRLSMTLERGQKGRATYPLTCSTTCFIIGHKKKKKVKRTKKLIPQTMMWKKIKTNTINL